MSPGRRRPRAKDLSGCLDRSIVPVGEKTPCRSVFPMKRFVCMGSKDRTPCPDSGSEFPDPGRCAGQHKVDPVANAFGDTRRSMDLKAACDHGPDAIEAWGRFDPQYWRPLRIFCRFRGDSAQMAEDQVQGLFGELPARGGPESLDPRRGRLRSWPRAAMEQHRTRVWRKTRARERNPTNGFDPREISKIEGVLELSAGGRPDQEHRRQWAMRVLENSRQALRERCRERDPETRFDLFWARLLPVAGSEDRTLLSKVLG